MLWQFVFVEWFACVELTALGDETWVMWGLPPWRGCWLRLVGTDVHVWLYLSLSCSHVVWCMRQSKCSSGLGQQPPSVHRSIACSPSGGPRRSSGADSSLVIPSAYFPAGSMEELGWQVFRAEVLRHVPASSAGCMWCIESLKSPLWSSLWLIMWK